MTITSQELALKCGVSRGTVDRALKGRKGVNPKTMEKVLAAASEYGYRPNFIGQALASGRTMTIGIVIFDFQHSFFAELYSAFEREADAFNYVTFPMLSYHDAEREIECIRRLSDRNIDGLIILPVNHGEDFEAMLKSLNIPVVCIGNRLSTEFPFAGIDDFKAAKDAVIYLAERDCSCIHYYCPPMRNRGCVNLYAQEQRLLGYEAGLRGLCIKGRAVTERETLLGLLKRSRFKAAVICSSDFYALELQVFLRDHHNDLYHNVTLMGFDGLEMIRFSNPVIPTVAFSRKAWALKAFDQIYNLMGGKNVRDEIIMHNIEDSGFKQISEVVM